MTGLVLLPESLCLGTDLVFSHHQCEDPKYPPQNRTDGYHIGLHRLHHIYLKEEQKVGQIWTKTNKKKDGCLYKLQLLCIYLLGYIITGFSDVGGFETICHVWMRNKR